ncbi:DUF2273 domain-containing protein [Enterococcus nangangensis]
MHLFWQQFKLPIICGGMGLLLAILLVTIGFFKTLLLLVLTALGVAVGFYLQATGFFEPFFNRKNNF